MKAVSTRHAAAFGWIGLIAVAVFAVMWLACLSVDSSWEWGVDSLSQFGVSDTDAADYFMYGCIASGAILAVFGIGLAWSQSPRAGLVSAGVLYIIAGVCVALLGYFDLDYEGGDLHDFFAVMAGILVLGASIAAAADYWSAGKTALGGVAVVLFCIAAACYLGLVEEEAEVWSIVCALVWTGIVGAATVAGGIKGGKKE